MAILLRTCTTPFNGRNIVTEGASDGKITFADCDINGTLIVRGGANITLDDCTADEIILRGGGTLNLVNGTEVKAVTVETTSALTAYSNTEIETLTIAYGADNSSLTGNGKLSKAFIRARNFSSSLVPDEFEIGNNLTAVFGEEKLQGSSDTQNSFAFTPFSTADDSSYYLNVLSNEDGKIYYYYTNNKQNF